MCRDCAEPNPFDPDLCSDHEQSPIHLKRAFTSTRECQDLHRMRIWKGECRLAKLDFQILPHVLRAYQPERDCPGDYQPQIDFSRGYPFPWRLSFTDVSVPSHHMIDGKHYDAEVVLSHTYSVNNDEKLVC